MRKILLATGFVSLLGLGALAADAPKKSCCTKPTVEAGARALKCSLTGRVIENCCCVQKEGKTHCTLANKDVETCCCAPVEAKDKTAK